MAKLSGKTINISSTNANGSTRIGINGRNRELPHNTEVAVSDAELQVLENSHVEFTVTGDAKAADLKDAVDAGGGEDTTAGPAGGHPAGADYLDGSQPSDPLVPVRLTPDADETPPGADHLSQTGTTVDEAAALEAAREQQAQAEAGETPPVVELTNADPNQTGTDQSETTATGANEGVNNSAPAEGGEGQPSGSTLNVEPFDADKTLEQSISKITQDFDEFDKDQLEKLLAAEKKGAKRVTLIDALERKLASA